MAAVPDGAADDGLRLKSLSLGRWLPLWGSSSRIEDAGFGLLGLVPLAERLKDEVFTVDVCLAAAAADDWRK